MEQDALVDSMSTEALQALYAKTVYLLRESRKEVLRLYAVDSEVALLEKIKNGEIGEHPAYDHYLSVLILDQTRMQMRAEMMEQFGDAPAAPDVCMHLIFKAKLEQYYANRMTEPVRLAQDALTLSFDTGLMMEVRYASSEEFSINWSWGDAELRMDTAPLHASCATFPVHLHDDSGTVKAGRMANSGLDDWRNFSGMLNTLLLDPLLEQVASL
ncbi:hypothetical protein [Herminiimonas sp. CN]|uniref:hypothetical protein n=1 Tax=Herminiimonas sp. CN TaxID=1349818 RepID=UPI001872AC8C|nr:hypothetical protein [Herminiimonas sp. CN]